jgi:hypothetical protein
MVPEELHVCLVFDLFFLIMLMFLAAAGNQVLMIQLQFSPVQLD